MEIQSFLAQPDDYFIFNYEFPTKKNHALYDTSLKFGIVLIPKDISLKNASFFFSLCYTSLSVNNISLYNNYT